MLFPQYVSWQLFIIIIIIIIIIIRIIIITNVLLAAVKSDYQGRISEGIHQALVAAESLRMYLVWLAKWVTNFWFFFQNFFLLFFFISLHLNYSSFPPSPPFSVLRFYVLSDCILRVRRMLIF